MARLSLVRDSGSAVSLLGVTPMKTKLVVLGLVLGLLAFAPAANAATITLDTPNAALAPYPSPYAFVEVTWIDATHAGITFTGAYNYLIGSNDATDLSVNATDFSIENLLGYTAPWTIGSGNVSEFGFFRADAQISPNSANL